MGDVIQREPGLSPKGTSSGAPDQPEPYTQPEPYDGKIGTAPSEMAAEPHEGSADTSAVKQDGRIRAAQTSLTLGPFRFSFWPDGDDPGVGLIEVEYIAGVDDVLSIGQVDGVSRFDWDRFVEATRVA